MASGLHRSPCIHPSHCIFSALYPPEAIRILPCRPPLPGGSYPCGIHHALECHECLDLRKLASITIGTTLTYQPGIGLWAADRLFRLLRIFLFNKLWLALPVVKTSSKPSTATLKLLTPSTLMISFQHPASYLKWTAGQHFYVIIPGLSRLPWEAHPFTCTTIPGHAGMGLGAGQVTFIVRVREGATKRMKDAVDKERKAQGLGVDEECSIDVPAALEGPYGEVRGMDMYDGVIIVAGES